PKIISFDAFGTLYTPIKPSVTQYYEIASLPYYNYHKPLAQLNKDFGVYFKYLYKKYPNYGKYSNIFEHADYWWAYLIRKLFEPYVVSNKFLNHLLNDLTFNAYSTFDDLKYISRKLKDIDLNNYNNEIGNMEKMKTKDNKIIFVVISNGDPRVKLILDSLKLSYKPNQNHNSQSFFNENFVFISYDIDLFKPDKKFFDYVLKSLISKGLIINYDNNNIENLQILLKSCWHIGDEYGKDVLGAKNAGWNAILVDRRNNFGFFSKRNVFPKEKLDLIDQKSTMSLATMDESQTNFKLDLIDEKLVITEDKTIIVKDLWQLGRVFNI
ncbi:Dpi35p ASCRUDRAFT_20059, partial [Ascoidea rubescens DSM 1968]